MKAFNTIARDILTITFQYSGVTLKLIESYLKDRSRYVYINNVASYMLKEGMYYFNGQFYVLYYF